VSNGYLGNAGVFLLQVVFGLYILAVMLRFLLQSVRADYYNPLVQALVRFTDPPLRPLRRVVPGVAGIDLAAVILLLALQMFELFLVGRLVGLDLPIATMILGSIAKLLDLLLSVFLWSILIRVVASWVSPHAHHPALQMVDRLTEPLIMPVRRLLPDLGGLDFSPLVVLVGVQLARMLLVTPIADLAGLPRGL
jgi:YggT family protein